ncbi:MAG: ketol-acid reductoisomerase [Candidatus Latescibacterota bacterium]|nr:MAG: ketol-acid reductoisomerase [Candidatus Latescibacterota bacterium]
MIVFKESDLTENLFEGGRIAVVGYGNQGHAHALNLRDSGINVVVGARPGRGAWQRAEADGFKPQTVPDAVRIADCVAVLLPDEVQAQAFENEIGPALSPGAALVFAHGFGVAFGHINPPGGHDVILVAPKGQGHFLRSSYVAGIGLPCLLGVEVDASGQAMQRALSYAQSVGCLGAGAIETTFREEAVTDLFGEQAVLCGGVPALVKAAFDTLVEAGYPPEVAYIECLHELKIITDLMAEGGVTYMKQKISRTAAWGSYLAEREIDTKALRATLRSILDRIESGEFADGWRDEAATGQRELGRLIDGEAAHGIENAGRPARALMQSAKEEER